jgi:hypothetical protein
MLACDRRIFTAHAARHADEELAIPSLTTPRLGHELVRGGRVRRLRRGLCAVDETYRGGPARRPLTIAMALVKPSAIGYRSALAHQGLTEHIPRVATPNTPGHTVTPRMRRPTSDRLSRPAAERSAASPSATSASGPTPSRASTGCGSTSSAASRSRTASAGSWTPSSRPTSSARSPRPLESSRITFRHWMSGASSAARCGMGGRHDQAAGPCARAAQRRTRRAAPSA